MIIKDDELSLLLFDCCLKPLKSLSHPLENQLTIKDSHIGLAVIHKQKNIFFWVIAKDSPMWIFSIFISQNQHSFCLLLSELMHPIMFPWLPKLEADLIAYFDGCDRISVGNKRMEGRMSHAFHKQDADINAISFNQEVLQLIFLLEIGAVISLTNKQFALFHCPVLHYFPLKGKAIQLQSFCLFFTQI